MSKEFDVEANKDDEEYKKQFAIAMKEKFEKEKKEFEEEGDGSKKIMAIDEEKLEEVIN